MLLISHLEESVQAAGADFPPKPQYEQGSLKSMKLHSTHEFHLLKMPELDIASLNLFLASS